MKTFKDLVFKTHPASFAGYGTISELNFDNGYGVSVITGGYGSKEKPYELAILLEGDLCYDTGILDDVAGWLTKDKVTEYMLKVQKLD